MSQSVSINNGSPNQRLNIQQVFHEIEKMIPGQTEVFYVDRAVLANLTKLGIMCTPYMMEKSITLLVVNDNSKGTITVEASDSKPMT